MQLKLSHKINGIILIIFVLIAIVFSSIHLPFQHRRMQTVMEKIELLLQTLVERDQNSLANEIFEGRISPLRIRLQQMRKVKGIVAISLFDNMGKLIVSDSIMPLDSELSEAEQKASAQGIQFQKQVWHGQNIFSYVKEIQAIGERIGFIRLYYSLADVDKEQHLSFMIFGGLLGSILVIMLVLLNLILKKTIVNPIIFLRDAMQQIRVGELGGQVKIRSHDEIGELSETFNGMSLELAESYHKLADSYKQIELQNTELYQVQESTRKLNEELEQRVEKRTAELTQANAEIRSLNEQLEASLVRSEKMAMLGQIIAGVAHEIRTPLGAIRASVDNISGALPQILEQLPGVFQSLSEDLQKDFLHLLERARGKRTKITAKEERKLKRKLTAALEEKGIDDADDAADILTDMGIYDNTDPFLMLFGNPETPLILQTAYNLSGLQRNSQNIATATDRAAKIVSALKNYARYDHTETLIKTNLAENIETVLTLYHNQLKYGIEVVTDYEEQLPLVMCYPDELNQVWANMIHNAIQAMEGKGTLSIGLCQKDEHVVITFTDTGKGISPDIKDQIFEPFFTTKSMGEGSGLGLDIVKKIIDKHKGKIEVESEPGKTVFSVFIPSC